jgi:16S rRNA C967 or C1407 C5-methylase (RsmB/RsmF family)/NOL1/NOP2/fmu family ribosome biogenesis protein
MSTLLPKEFMASLQGVEGFDAGGFERVHAGGRQSVSVRVNPMKWTRVGADTTEHGAATESWRGSAGWGDHGAGVLKEVPWSSFGYYLEERPSFTFDPLFHAGLYYVQEASGMFLEQALSQTMDLSLPLKVLDLCAAPGGKSTLIQSLISGNSLLVSNEVIRSRAAILEENIVKWGAANTVITHNDPRDFQRMENYFDVLVVDAPCSGSGLFRREPEAIAEWSLDNVRLCSQRQQRILADCWAALRQGGVLIYCTCSYSKEEDEDILDWLIGQRQASSLKLQVQREWNIVESVSKTGGHGYRFYPDKLEGEGFFIACVRKNDGGEFTQPGERKSRSGKSPAGRSSAGNPLAGKLTRQEEQLVKSWTREDLPLLYFMHNDHVYALPEHLGEELPFLQSCCYLKKAGVMAGKLATKEFIPEHELALSGLIASGLPALGLSHEQAIRYLRKEEIAAGAERKGWALAQYEGHNLGWMKILANRVNNYYPREWRILKRDR